MKTLLLVRHAKSSWDHAGLRDFDRPLAARGSAAAPAMGAYMRREELVPEIVLCSSARRTRDTWSLMSEPLGGAPEVLFLDELYGASPRTILEVVRNHAGASDTVLVVSHNPGTEDLAAVLAGAGPDRLLDQLHTKYPTGALAVIDLEVDDWAQVRPGAGVLRLFVRPKDVER